MFENAGDIGFCIPSIGARISSTLRALIYMSQVFLDDSGLFRKGGACAVMH